MRRAPGGVGLGLGVSPLGLATPAGSLYPKKGIFPGALLVLGIHMSLREVLHTLNMI